MNETFDSRDILRWTGATVRYLDQTLLPLRICVEETQDYKNIIEAIQRLEIRGAPLLGIAAGYGLLLAGIEYQYLPPELYKRRLLGVCDEIGASRPTAVNLFWALEKLRGIIHHSVDPKVLFRQLEDAAVGVHRDDAQRCESIGKHGATIIPDDARILTHCNTGALATGGDGTAFSAILTAYRQGKRIHVYACETRPLLQGARLTMWELQRHGVPATLITDSTGSVLMRRRDIDLVITGADRIAANGDTANKIGTYSLAVAAAYHTIPFYIAAPLSTVDLTIETGESIPIEERSPEEITNIQGCRIAPEGVEVFAPAFDVTPHELITAIVTERGILKPPFKETISNILAP